MEIFENKMYRDTLSSQGFNNGRGWITIFTPTYNREKYINRPYNSFLQQTDQHFIWIIVDDGSSDGTKKELLRLLSREEIPMLVISKQNGGKHSAFQVALDATKTEFFICADDDDKYYETAVEIFLNEWEKISEDKLDDIGAIRALTQYDDGRIASNFTLSDTELGGHCDISTLDIIFKEKKLMENWTCYSVDSLRSINLFSSVTFGNYQQKFFSEGIWQSRFARKYKCRFLYTPLRTYYLDSGSSLSRRTETRQKYIDDFYNSFLFFTENIDYIVKYTPFKKWIKDVAIISIKRNRLKIPFFEFLKQTRARLGKFLFVVMFPLSKISSRYKLPKK